ncbi:recombinase family protein [Slackia heliotrinireducens]|uniref:recombinase family protein n=1 Tax=Slackia heliotrinireducens TaxID=84110 RepID=UPI0018D59980|nr:recombinase family protein [Slackia heliotrinireducens]
MTGVLVGYARVSTDKQVLDRQLDALKAYGVDERLIYQETGSGAKRYRPELKRMLDELNEGDTVVVAEMTRISRSTRDMLNIIDLIREKGCNIKSLNESWLDTTDDNPSATMMVTVLSAMAQFERDTIRVRTLDGLKAANARGRHGGRPSVREAHADAVVRMRGEGKTIPEIVEAEGISRATVYRILRDAEEETGKRE